MLEPRTMAGGRRPTTLWVSLAVTAALSLVMIFLPVPYATTLPGPTRDVLGSTGGREMIQILSGAQAQAVTGELHLTTVAVTGNPHASLPVISLVQGWLDPAVSVEPVEYLFDLSQTEEQRTQASNTQMITSQEFATYAALTELGYQIPTTLFVGDILIGSGADGVLRLGDQILSLDGTRVTDYTQLITMLGAITPGATLHLVVKRDDQEIPVQVVSGEQHGRAQIGIFVDPKFSSPVEVSIQIDNIGGPSAGLIFALGIIDKLTPADELQGAHLAGTGTIGLDGKVGPIGGIAQKMVGAARAGVKWFLAPALNCAEVAGNVPAGMKVIRVQTLHDARVAMVAIGAGQGDSLPTCG